MDPITAAILAGVAAGATDVAAQVIKDAYSELKRALKRKFGAGSKVIEAVDNVEGEPAFAPNQQTLAGRMAQVGAPEDKELLELATTLAEALQTTSEGKQALDKYNVTVSGGQVGIIGDHAKVEGGLHFGDTGRQTPSPSESAGPDESVGDRS